MFLLGITLIASALIYFAFSSSGSGHIAEEFERLPENEKVEAYAAFEKIAVKREVASRPQVNETVKEEAPQFKTREATNGSEYEPYLEEKRESVALAKEYLSEYGAKHSDQERRELEEMLAELDTAVDIIKIHMIRNDSDRAYDLEDRFDDVLSKFESKMKE